VNQRSEPLKSKNEESALLIFPSPEVLGYTESGGGESFPPRYIIRSGSGQVAGGCHPEINWRMDVLRCPECSAEIDVDEDEVEEGEILSCPECETELEVSQTHPVALNPISDELEEEDDLEEEDEEDEEFGEDGDLPEEDEVEEEEEDEDQ
jgi:alpha-aminoadipate/glutamate carrier protein LysW